jgi:NAD(P)H-dependent FMN reductase
MEKIKVLAFAASARKGSVNKKLIKLAAEFASAKGATVDVAEFSEFDMPLYNGDLEEKSGVPEGALELQRRLAAADALIISAPEYNHSIPGTLKNAIDWVSRVKPSPIAGKACFLLSASPSPFGGIRCVMATREPLEGLGMIVHPDTFCLIKAPQAFDESGKISDPANMAVLGEMIGAFLELASSLKKD